MVVTRVPSKQTKNYFRFEPKRTETQSVSVVFRFCFTKPKMNFSVCFDVSNMYRNNRKKHTCFETKRNKPKTFLQPNTYSYSVGILLQADSSKCVTKLLQTNTHRCSKGSCGQTCPGVAQSSCRQTHPGAAQSSCRQTRPCAAQKPV